MHMPQFFTLHYTGNKFLQFGLEGNKYNKSLNHATHQNTELTIHQETIQLAQMKINFFQ